MTAIQRLNIQVRPTLNTHIPYKYSFLSEPCFIAICLCCAQLSEPPLVLSAAHSMNCSLQNETDSFTLFKPFIPDDHKYSGSIASGIQAFPKSYNF